MIVEVGAGLRSYSVGGVDVTVPYGEDVIAPQGLRRRARAVAEPAARRAVHLRGHGRCSCRSPSRTRATRRTGWGGGRVGRVRDTAGRSVTMSLDLVPQTGWPFEVRVDVTYALRSRARAGRDRGRAQPRHRARAVRRRLPPLPRAARSRGSTTSSLQPAGAAAAGHGRGAVPVGVQPVGRDAVRLHRAARGSARLRMDDGFTGSATDRRTRRGRGATPSGGARLWFEETFRYLQVFTIDALRHRSARHRDRADDLRRRRVQLRRRADRARAGRHLDRARGASPRSDPPALTVAAQRVRRCSAPARPCARWRGRRSAPGSRAAARPASTARARPCPATARSSGTQRRT